MFRIESYITPIIWSYFSKYVKNFNSHDFQVSLWNGGAVFSNLELNLDVLDSELQIPLSFVSGHIQELKITVPWRKITSEPIVLNVNSMELVLTHRERGENLKRKKATDIALQSKESDPNQDQNSGYMRSLITKIVSNVRVSFENVVIKYVESDIAFSVNVGEASMAVADENWKTAFLDRIAYSPDFILRKKLSFSDVNICLDRCNNAGLVDKFQDPMLYRCDFDVRIIQKFATSFSRVPYFYRMDLFLGHLQFCVTDEQIPMLVRLYNLFSWLMESGTIDAQVNESKAPESSKTEVDKKEPVHETAIDIVSTAVEGEQQGMDNNSLDNSSWTSWATGLLFNLPVAVFGEEDDEEEDIVEEIVVTEELCSESKDTAESKKEGFVHEPPPVLVQSLPEQKEELAPLPPPTTHFGVYINTLTIILKAVKRVCDRLVMQRRIISIFPFLKCSIQGVVCDFIARGNENSHTMGVSSIMVDGLGYCPCGVQDCSSSEAALPAQGGECYFEAGKINPDFANLSFFSSSEELQSEWCYEVDHKSLLCFDEESKMLEKTPAFFLRYIVIRTDSVLKTDHSKNNLQSQTEICEVMYHGVSAPCKILVCSGLIHRLKMIYGAINNYGYEPYGLQLPSSNSKLEFDNTGLQQPVTTYRLVVRQPLIEVFAADHPSDYSPLKRAEYFRRSGGIVPTIALPRLTPEWPRMVISWDILECTAEDMDGHFGRIRACASSQAAQETFFKSSKSMDHDAIEQMYDKMDAEQPGTASIRISIAEVLLTFISEPMEMNVGIKAGCLLMSFTNRQLCHYSNLLHHVESSIYLESMTCSSRLEQRSNILWLPFSMTALSTLSVPASLLWQPSIRIEIDCTSLNLFVGPETIITVSQLMQKLQIYLEEFLPKLSSPVTTGGSSRTTNPLWLVLSDNFQSKSVVRYEECTGTCNHKVEVAFYCFVSRSFSWLYPNKRTVHAIHIPALPSIAFGEDLQEVHLVLEYHEPFTREFHHFRSFTMSQGVGIPKQTYSNLEENVISSSQWRIRVVDEITNPQAICEILEMLSGSLVVDSIHVPEVSVQLQLPEVRLSLVNNTFYGGKQVKMAAVQPYGNTEGVCPADHILAEFYVKDGKVYYSGIEGMARCNMSLSMDLKVLEYESVVLEPVVDSVAVALELFIPEIPHPYSLKLATDSVNMKIGASLMHSVMNSTALWNQIIYSFDAQNFKMASNENQAKIILNRVLVSNDLNTEVQIRCTDLEAFGAETILSKDCKAISFPSKSGSVGEEKVLFLSVGAAVPEVKISLQKLGYTPYKLLQDSIFVKISRLSTSQKLVQISGPILLANGLDRAVEVSMLLHSGTSPLKITVPSRGTGPTVLCSLEAVEHFRFRFVSSSCPQPWSEVVYASVFPEAEETSPLLINMLSHAGGEISEAKFWLTKISEDVGGAKRYLMVLSPVYAIRSWLCSETLVHLFSLENKNSDVYKVAGKGKEVEVKATAEYSDTYFMKFQSSSNVSPSGHEVHLKGITSSLSSSNRVKSIDELVAQLCGSGSNSSTGQENVAKWQWPFIEDDIPVSEWNTEINPETEIMVSNAPWIDGLPTTAVEIRPWAVFINLSGVDLLFAQEVQNQEWDQFWLPYKCTFSPKRMEIPKGKFRIGVMMNDFLVKSPPLQFSDQPERLSVKNINKDGKVPIDCYSRLDLFGGSQVACFTIETRVQNKILIFVVRPTYSIQNRTPLEMFAAGVTIASATPQRRESWTDDRLAMYSRLDPCFDEKLRGPADKTAVPVLHFTTDGQDYSVEHPSYKYLALSCGGPWWFTQLVDCSDDSPDRKSSKGIPGSVLAVNLPKMDCSVLSARNRHKLKNFKIASESLVVGLYTKNGQVWISVIENKAPQFTIHNKSNLPLFYAEKDPKGSAPCLPTPCFQQFLMVPPSASCHFNSCNTYNNFPNLHKREVAVPDMLLAEVSQDLVDFVASHHAQSLIALSRQAYSGAKQTTLPSGNLLFPDFDIGWQNVLNVSDNPTQYAKFGQQSVKISVEIVGYTFHVFVENTRMKEFSAKDVRVGFTVPRISETRPNESIADSAFQSQEKRSSNNSLGILTGNMSQGRLTTSLIGLEEHDGDEQGPPSPVDDGAKRKQAVRPWKIRAHIPELYVSFQDDIHPGSGKSECEFLGLALEPIIFEQVPLIEDSKLRPAECQKLESWIYAIRIGNMQVDTPNVSGQRPCEFPVVLEAVSKSERCTYQEDKSAFAVSKYMSSVEQPSTLNFDSTITVTRVTAEEVSLDTVWLKILPFSLFIEDRLVSYVMPSFQNIVNVFNEGYLTMELSTVNAAAASGTPLYGQRNSPTAESGITAHISILDSTVPFDGAFGLFRGNQSKKTTSTANSASLLSRSISFAPGAPSSSSGLNSSNSSIISSSLSHLRLASVSPPPPSPMMHLEPHGSGGKIGIRPLPLEVADSGLDQKSESQDEDSKDVFAIQRIKVPVELLKLFDQLSRPVRVKMIDIQPTELELTLRTGKVMYVSLDRSVVQLRPFVAFSSVTTHFHLGLELVMHYTVGTIFTIGNPVRVVGSLELLGSPGTLARTVGTGLRDLVVYPYEGILNGPVGFVSGLGYGVSSLLRSVTSGTLNSLTNWAQSVSRNIDRLTLDEQEQLISEAARQVELQGFSDGIVQGLNGFGIRILGAIGGISHHPINSVIQRGSVIGGVGRGMIGAVAKPIGGVAELISMTGQGVLLATGWKPRPKTKKSKKKSG